MRCPIRFSVDHQIDSCFRSNLPRSPTEPGRSSLGRENALHRSSHRKHLVGATAGNARGPRAKRSLCETLIAQKKGFRDLRKVIARSELFWRLGSTNSPSYGIYSCAPMADRSKSLIITQPDPRHSAFDIERIYLLRYDTSVGTYAMQIPNLNKT